MQDQGIETSLAHEFQHAATKTGQDPDKEKAEKNAVDAENLVRKHCPCAASPDRGPHNSNK
jgi:hypothetical protein